MSDYGFTVLEIDKTTYDASNELQAEFPTPRWHPDKDKLFVSGVYAGGYSGSVIYTTPIGKAAAKADLSAYLDDNGWSTEEL